MMLLSLMPNLTSLLVFAKQPVNISTVGFEVLVLLLYYCIYDLLSALLCYKDCHDLF